MTPRNAGRHVSLLEDVVISHNGQHHTLARVTREGKQQFVLMEQLRASFFPTSTVKSFQGAMRSAGSTTRPANIKPATRQEVLMLQAAHHISSKCFIVQLVSIKSAKTCLAALGLSTLQLAGLSACTTAPAASVSSGGSSVPNIGAAEPRPERLPVCNLSEEWKSKKYGLNQNLSHIKNRWAINQLPSPYPCMLQATVTHLFVVACRAELMDQLSKFIAWITDKHMFNREGRKLDNSTYERMESIITCFLGYCHRFHGVAVPNLTCGYDVHMLLAYLSFLEWKGTACHTYDKFFNATKKVILFWMAHSKDPEATKVRLGNYGSSAVLHSIVIASQQHGVQVLESLVELLYKFVRSQVVHGAPMKLYHIDSPPLSVYSAQEMMAFQVG